MIKFNTFVILSLIFVHVCLRSDATSYQDVRFDDDGTENIFDLLNIVKQGSATFSRLSL